MATSDSASLGETRTNNQKPSDFSGSVANSKVEIGSAHYCRAVPFSAQLYVVS